MLKNAAILLAAGTVLALPFIFKQEAETGDWKPGDPELVIVSSHNEAIRYEFGQAFSKWHAEKFGKPVRIDWRALGGTTEISRYLTAEFVASARAYCIRQGIPWSSALGDAIVDRKFNTNAPPKFERKENESDEAFATRDAENRRTWERAKDLHAAFRSTDDKDAFSARIDLFFGGGEYDHSKAFGEGLTVPPWPKDQTPDLFTDGQGNLLIPDRISGETWRSAAFFGNAISTFGICYNLDRLADLGVTEPPRAWSDLANPKFYRQLGLADPTKSGSIAKAFEMIIHQQCFDAVQAAGFTKEQIDTFEASIKKAALPPGELPPDVPAHYQEAVEQGWLDGIRLVQLIGANARYFTDSASKVPIDVSIGNAAAGVAIDFYGRYQAQLSRSPEGKERMVYVTPKGGSGASADPISLLRGATHREIACRFITFVLSEDGQKLWTYKPGTPGGPEKFALRRLPILRSFYPSDVPAVQARHEAHARFAADDLADPATDPYTIAAAFTYYSRWTGQHFGVHRDLIRTMCMDSSAELQAAWSAILGAGGPEKQAEAMQILCSLPDQPEPLTWKSALGIGKKMDRIEYMRIWTLAFRDQYRRAREAAERSAGS